ncbi:ribosome biogenesis GTPase YlqF [Pseudoteredinibacter isoporae]|uniref:ribosome biogenesis GTPase YlqF n=1 Tax=Pseudoteredinibacter isoporae TaxID=570281 RepID=UPI003105E079
MAIQWYPGHMHKAQKEVREAASQIDLYIEVLDARLPYSSQNPMIAELRGDKPSIKVLTKTDLADPQRTEIWQQHFEQEAGVKTLAITNQQSSKAKILPDLCRKLLPDTNQFKTINAMILGIPNVGKSTLINTLAGRSIAKVGNEPAVTKGQQKINLRNGIMLWDTPGMLWPKVENEHSAYRLGVSGAIKDTAMEYEDIAYYAIGFLQKHYPELLKARYQLNDVYDSEIDNLEAIAKRRACVRAGGRADLHKVSELLIKDLRSGQIGDITLETPDMITHELADVKRIKEEKAAQKEARRKARAPQRGNHS